MPRILLFGPTAWLELSELIIIRHPLPSSGNTVTVLEVTRLPSTGAEVPH